MTFGDRVKYLLKRNDLSQHDLAGMLEITVARLNNYLNDKTEAGYVILSQIAQKLDTTTDYLLGRSFNFYSPKGFYSKDRPPFRVFHSETSGSDEAHFLQLPVYLGGNVEESGSPQCFSKIAVSDRDSFMGGFCIKAVDKSMFPFIIPGDLVYFKRPTQFPVDGSDSKTVYALRLTENDRVGVYMGYCIRKGDNLFFMTVDPTTSVATFNLKELNYNPVTGVMAGLSRVYGAD